MTAPTIQQQQLNPALLWEHFVARGLDKKAATALVQEHQRRAALPNVFPDLPEKAGLESTIADAVVNFGHGASFGFSDELAGALFGRKALEQNRAYIEQARQRSPKTSFGADLLGTAAVTALAGPALAGTSAGFQGAVLGAGAGTLRGAGEGETTAQREAGAAIGGVAGGALGFIGGRAVQGATPNVRTVWNNLIGNSKRAMQMRQKLIKAGVSPEAAERTIVEHFAPKPTMTMRSTDTPIQSPMAQTIQPTAQTLAAQRGETITPITGSTGGFEVTGVRATPKAPGISDAVSRVHDLTEAGKPGEAAKILRAALKTSENQSLALDRAARELVLRQQGFSIGEASQMAESNVAVPKALLADARRRLTAIAKSRKR